MKYIKHKYKYNTVELNNMLSKGASVIYIVLNKMKLQIKWDKSRKRKQ